MPRFSVGQYMQKCKQAREESFKMKRKLELAQTELSQLENELHEKKKLLCALKERKRRMESKVSGYIHAYLFKLFWSSYRIPCDVEAILCIAHDYLCYLKLGYFGYRVMLGIACYLAYLDYMSTLATPRLL